MPAQTGKTAPVHFLNDLIGCQSFSTHFPKPPMFQLESVSLRGNDRWRLHRVTHSFVASATAIIGYSGAGKSSLLNVLAGYEQPDLGRIQRPGTAESGALRLPVFWVPQTGGLWPHLTVLQHLLAVQPDSRSVRKDSPFSADEILDQFALSHLANARPSELSLGESSRLATARGLAARPEWLIMDEPLSHIDPVRKPAYWNSIRSLARAAGICLIFSCHEPEVVLRQAELAVCLHHGEISFSGTVRSLYSRPPSAELGRFLGPLNWWTASEAAALSASADSSCSKICIPADCGLRPHQVRLHQAPASALRVVGSQHCGLHHETLLRAPTGPTIMVFHQHSESDLLAGSGVAISLRGDV
jgi:iron(III) transport system ATP-binding protein